MQARYHAAISGLVVLMAMSVGATAQSLEALRAARDQAKTDLIKAQDAFDRADGAYIKALGEAASRATAAVPASPRPPAPSVSSAASPTPASDAASAVRAPASASAATAPASAAAQPLEVKFTMNGTGSLEASPFDYRGRLFVDGRPLEWTETASGSKQTASSETRSLAYEVQHDAKSDPTRPEWKTICQGSLPLNRRTTVEIEIGRSVTCRVR